MKTQTYIFGLLVVLMAYALPPAFAQDSEPPLPSTEEAAVAEPQAPASQEVEINEDNYRQFMELKDAMRQRDIIPENVFKPGSGLQKLKKLPEESQKHLRNQLREIIVQGDPWQPGDEETEYPYTPSVAASTDPSLEKQELEAWGELVDSYHEREAQIYENSSGSQAARGSEQGSSNSQQNGTGASTPTGQGEEGGQGQQAGQEGNPDQSDSEGTYSLNGSNDASDNSTAGVSQNAMEFLQGLGQGGSGPGNGTQGDSEESGPGGNSPTPAQTEAQAQAQQADSAGTGGTSQNAMEFLQGLANSGEATGDGESTNPSSAEPGGNSPTPSESLSHGSSGQQESSESANPTASGAPGTAQIPNAESTEGSSQNALEFLSQNSGSSESQGESSTGTSETGEAQAQTPANDSEEKRVVMQKDGQDDGQDTEASEPTGNRQEEGQDDDSSQSDQPNDQSEPDSAMPLPANTPPVSSNEPEAESTVGSSQNALEYLTGENAQGEEDMDAAPDATQPDGTLSTQDLLNARGTGSSADSTPESVDPIDSRKVEENTPDKDKDG